MSTTSNGFKWAFIGDLQMPYHDVRAVSLWFKVMKWWKPSVIDVLGDIDDQLEYSSFSDGTTDEFFNSIKKSDSESPLPFVKENAEVARRFYADIRRQHKDAEIHASLGNHDIRVFKYIDKKAPEYIDQITPDFLWGLDNEGISYRHYEDPPLLRYAGIHVHHGATTSSTGAAVGKDIDNYGISLARGHDHRGQIMFKTYPMANRSLIGIAAGHMCDPSQYGLRYTINPSWELGFAIAHVYDEEIYPQFIRISPDYECVVDGKRFQG